MEKWINELALNQQELRSLWSTTTIFYGGSVGVSYHVLKECYESKTCMDYNTLNRLYLDLEYT